MSKIALVTDSTADLTKEMQKELNVHVIPLKLRFAEEEFKDGEITPEQFYARLANSSVLPQTSQPSPDEFIRFYQSLLTEYDEILSIHLSSGLSGTLNSAHLAKEKLQEKIHLVDSRTISLGAGLMVMEAAQLIREGLAIPSILAKLAAARKKIPYVVTFHTGGHSLGHRNALRAAAERSEVRVECHQGDLADLGFATSASVDLVVASHTLNASDDLPRLLRQVHRVLKPGAPFVVATTHPVAVMFEQERTATHIYAHGVTSFGDLYMAFERSNFHLDMVCELNDRRVRDPLCPSVLVVRARKQGV